MPRSRGRVTSAETGSGPARDPPPLRMQRDYVEAAKARTFLSDLPLRPSPKRKHDNQTEEKKKKERKSKRNKDKIKTQQNQNLISYKESAVIVNMLQ